MSVCKTALFSIKHSLIHLQTAHRILRTFNKPLCHLKIIIVVLLYTAHDLRDSVWCSMIENISVFKTYQTTAYLETIYWHIMWSITDQRLGLWTACHCFRVFLNASICVCVLKWHYARSYCGSQSENMWGLGQQPGGGAEEDTTCHQKVQLYRYGE